MAVQKRSTKWTSRTRADSAPSVEGEKADASERLSGKKGISYKYAKMEKGKIEDNHEEGLNDGSRWKLTTQNAIRIEI